MALLKAAAAAVRRRKKAAAAAARGNAACGGRIRQRAPDPVLQSAPWPARESLRRTRRPRFADGARSRNLDPP
eukprot:CAMPEP_0171551838 /NCGR_PEP_ID=MMETSP0960-20121227/7962_1 /TAXON_ID=87120 /ORGANISM="Aurantiochytrium limacinum, Strain ATCCMYA-1381" /LENGTH=72 /DNA_ID=CAMNT_0012101169 /DNA_START=1128 /DNA_END=1342 /DNA_ORIENTATION=-